MRGVIKKSRFRAMTAGISVTDSTFITSLIKKYFPLGEIIVFGSRANGTNRTDSDLDVCIRDLKALPLAEWQKLSQEFIDSDLPYKVDLCDWHRLSQNFQKVISSTGHLLA